MSPFNNYFTSSQTSTCDDLQIGKRNAFEILAHFGMRLRKALGDEEVLSRNHWIGGEFRVPTYRACVESLNRNPWTVYTDGGRQYTVTPYSETYEGRSTEGVSRSGFMASAISPYEFAYEFWDEFGQRLYPDLFDDGTFGVWSGLLPQPISIVVQEGRTELAWAANEPRVRRSNEMGRYCLPDAERKVSSAHPSWRYARAEAYVLAWEKMAANEPEDRYKSIMLEEHKLLYKR